MQKSIWIFFCVLMLSLNICGCSSVRMPESITTAQPVFVIPTSGSHTPTPTLEADPCTSIETRKPEIEKWALDMYKFMSDKYGEDNIAAFIVHLDETNPHIHCTLLPVVDNGRKTIEIGKKQVPSFVRSKPPGKADG